MTHRKNKSVSVRHQKRVLPCPHCKTTREVIRWGFQRNDLQRYYCKTCGKTFNKRTNTMFARLRTRVSEIVDCVQSLLENQGHRNASRSRKRKRRELVNWLQRAGLQCKRVVEKTLKPVTPVFLEFDELYSFVYCKELECYVWTCIDAVHKTLLGFHVSFDRTLEECKAFFKTFAHRVREIAGASSDGLQEYATLMNKRYPRVPFAQIVKIHEGRKLVEVKKKQCGKHTIAEVEDVIIRLGLGCELNTSAIERLNTTLRAFLACLNRRSLKHAKNDGNLEALLHAFQAYYDLCLKHETLSVTPACSAGLTRKQYSLREVLLMRA